MISERKEKIKNPLSAERIYSAQRKGIFKWKAGKKSFGLCIEKSIDEFLFICYTSNTVSNETKVGRI